MCKKVTNFFFLFSLFGAASLLQGEITVGLLKSVPSNAKVNLLDHSVAIQCEPHGIIPLEMMPIKAENPKECAQKIDAYYRSHPDEKHFVLRILHREQIYHYEKIDSGCVLYTNGRESLSEMLLRQGLAIPDPAFNNLEWNAKIQRAYKGAEKWKTGLHDTEIVKTCIKEEG